MADWRNIQKGSVIPDEGYADQPYIVKTRDGAWLCVITTGPGEEGQGGQHVVVTRSTDQGRTWSKPIDVEPGTGPEASWAVPLATPSGRIYIFYTYNANNVRVVPDVASPGIAKRVDTLGKFVFKYSDDGGRTWSAQRYEVKLPLLEADRRNNFQGREIFFWSVAKPLVDRGQVFIGIGRVTKWGLPGVLMRSRGFVLRSDNVLTEMDPGKVRFRQLPETEEGLRAPKGPIAEELNVTALSDGTLYSIWRSIDGYLCQAYSTDRGLTWTAPAYATYAPAGRRIKNPRAFSFCRRFANGRYLLWFHNNGGEVSVSREKWNVYLDRNPGWVLAGTERNGRLHWSEPEILLYDDDPPTRMSYPDFVEENGKYWISETQKTVARIHPIDDSFLQRLWNPVAPKGIETTGEVSTSAGFSIAFTSYLEDLYPGPVAVTGEKLQIAISDRFSWKLTLGAFSHESDAGTHEGTLVAGRKQQVVVTVDGGSGIVWWMVDGVFNDGGATRQMGWGRLPRDFAHFSTRPTGPGVTVYGRALLVNEAAALFTSL